MSPAPRDLSTLSLDERLKTLRLLTFAAAGSPVMFGGVMIAMGLPLVWSDGALLRYVGTVVLGGAIYLAATPISRRLAPEYPARVNPLTIIRLVGALIPGEIGLLLCFTFPDDGILPVLLGGVTSIVALLVWVVPRKSNLPDYQPEGSVANVIEYVGENPVIERP